jgi:hypothetical protein
LQYLTERHQKRIERLDKLESIGSGSAITTPILMGVFRKIVPGDSTLMIEVLPFSSISDIRELLNMDHVSTISVLRYLDNYLRQVQEV